MLRFVPPLALAVTLFAFPAQAALNQKRYVDMSRVTCEDKQTMADMEEITKNMRFPSPVKVISSATVRKADRKLVCKVVLRYTKGSVTKNTKGLFYLNVFPDGKWRVNFDPNY